MGLDPQTTNALRALAAARSPEEGAAERAWGTMQQRLVDGPPPLDIGVATPPNEPAAARWVTMGIAIAALLVAAVGLASWSAGWLAGVDARPPAEAPYSTTTVPEPEPTTASERVEAVPVAPESEPAISTPTIEAPLDPVAVAKPGARRSNKPSRRVDPDPPASEPATKTTTLEAEMRLLARANAAMRAGNPAGALAVLDEHARDFAGGQLAPEREYKRAVALCELGKTAKARAIADAFVRAHPRSPLRAKAESVCREGDGK